MSLPFSGSLARSVKGMSHPTEAQLRHAVRELQPCTPGQVARAFEGSDHPIDPSLKTYYATMLRNAQSEGWIICLNDGEGGEPLYAHPTFRP